ncbi:MAG: PorV/PorQ family protein [Bacteroidota bacterium]
MKYLNISSRLRTASLLVLLLTMVCTEFGLAQSKVGTTAAPFLTIGTGARATALGHAYTATATGADALFWNVSGAAIPQDGIGTTGSAMFTNHQLFVGIDYNAFALTLPISGTGVLGLSGAIVDYGTMDVTTAQFEDGTGEIFSAQDLVVGLSYAQPLTSTFYIGGQAKYISQRIWDMRANTIAVDIGLTLITDYLNGMKLAASIQNFGGQLQLEGINVRETYDPDEDILGNNDRVFIRRETDSFNIPISFRFGVAIPLIKETNYDLQVFGESHQTNDQNLNGDFGSEFTYKTNSTKFFIRGGYRDAFINRNDIVQRWSYGAGLEVTYSQLRFGFDFAVAENDFLQDTRMIDFRIYF